MPSSLISKQVCNQSLGPSKLPATKASSGSALLKGPKGFKLAKVKAPGCCVQTAITDLDAEDETHGI